MIALGLCALLLAAMALASIRLMAGPTLYDRALAAHAMALLAALALAALAVAAGRPDWIDAAIALVLADVTLAVVVLKCFRFRSLQPPMAPPEEGA